MFGYWEKVDKKHCLELLGKTKQLISFYQLCHTAALNQIVPARLHSAINGLAGAIARGENFYAWYTDVKAIYEAIETLNKLKINNDPLETARAFGKLFVALGALAAKVPAAQFYAQALTAFGKNFEQITARMLPSAHGSEGLDGDLKAFLDGKPSYINGR